jgi:hypothetical protein
VLVRTPIKVNTQAFCLICLRECNNGRCQIFLLSSFLGPAPSPPQLNRPQWLPLSFSLTHRAGTCLPLLGSKGDRGGPNNTTAKQKRFSCLLLFHANVQYYSFSISNLVLAVPSTEILEWITNFHTSKHFTTMKHTHIFPKQNLLLYYSM